MRWPWVSRELLDEVRGQLDKSEKECERLTKLLEEKKATPPSNVTVEEDAKSAKQPVAGSTPFDRIGNKFDQIDTVSKSKFIARIH